MARAETMQSVGEPGRGGSDPLPRHHSCRSSHTWPRLFIPTGSGTGTGGVHLYRNSHHLLPLQGVCVLHSLPCRHPEDQGELRTHRQPHAFSPTPPPLPLCSQRDDIGVAPSALSEVQSGSESEEHQDAFSRRGPLPDLLPHGEHPHHRALQELEVRRVANQLRAVGDEFNAALIRRALAEPRWRDWRDVWRGLFNFITQTLSTLYRLT